MSLRFKAATRLRSAQASVFAPRVVPYLAASVLALSVVLPMASSDPPGRDARAAPSTPAGHHPSDLATGRPAGLTLRSLPHGAMATIGTAPFATAPPKAPKAGAAFLVSTTAGVPRIAIAAYMHASQLLAFWLPSCHLSWADVAAIGRVESDNGLTFGSQARITSNGTLVPPILGPLLDGENGTPDMPAPGGGFIQAEGPMQFLPATWNEYARDGNGDGKKDPQNFYDAALTTGMFLCDNGGNLRTVSNLRAAIFAYNHSADYVTLVMSWVAFYTKAGVQAVATAGAGLLPVAPPGSPLLATGRAALTAAALASLKTGSFTFTFKTLRGTKTEVTGSGAVNERQRTASIDMAITGIGSVQLRSAGGKTYVLLPAGAAPAGEGGEWLIMTPGVTADLPAGLGSGLVLAADELPWLVGQFIGGTSSVHLSGQTTAQGMRVDEYEGALDLQSVRRLYPNSATDLNAVAAILKTAQLSVVAAVSLGNRLVGAIVSLPRSFGGGGLTVDIQWHGYGQTVNISAPEISPTTTTTTTTSTTSTTTTSTSTTTTTTAPTTTTTTTPGTTTSTTSPSPSPSTTTSLAPAGGARSSP